MKGRGAEFEGDADEQEYHAIDQVGPIRPGGVNGGADPGELQGTGQAIDHGNAIQQDARRKRAQHKVFHRGLGSSGGITPHGDHGIQRQR